MQTSFEWDEQKNDENVQKHGVNFETAQYVFIDAKRVIAEEQVIGGRGKVFMKKGIKYNDESIEARVVSDFLPLPEKLVLKEKKRKFTLILTEKTVAFFKQSAEKHGSSYQAMIRNLLDYYVANQKV